MQQSNDNDDRKQITTDFVICEKVFISMEVETGRSGWTRKDCQRR